MQTEPGTITLSVPATKAGAQLFRAAANMIEEVGGHSTDSVSAPKAAKKSRQVEDDDDGETQRVPEAAPRKRGRPAGSKNVKRAKDEDEEQEQDEDQDEQDDEAEDDDQDDGEDEAPAKVTRDTIQDAFTSYAKKHSRPAAMRILRKFAGNDPNVSVDDIVKKDYPAVLKALKKAPAN